MVNKRMKETVDEIAFKIAAKAHAGSTRSDQITPYFEHCMFVATAVRIAGGDATVVAAALLHDVIEDTEVKPSDLLKLVGDKVTDLVVELTFPSGMPDRRKRMLERVPTMSASAKLIKLADIYCNLSDLPNSGWGEHEKRQYFKHLLAMRVALAGTDASLEKAFDDLAAGFTVADSR